MPPRSLKSAESRPWLLPTVATALALVIFVVDAFTPLGMAVAVLYVLVILIAARFSDPQELIVVAAACAGLTVLAFLLAHGINVESTSFARCLVSLAAILVTTLLVLQNKKAENALRRSEAQLAEAQKLSATGSFEWIPARGEIVWSSETYRIFEYDPDLKPTTEMVLARTHPADRAAVNYLFKHIGEWRKKWEIKHRLLMPDGRVKFVSVVGHAEPITAGAVEFVGAIMDVTAARRAEDDLRQAQADMAHMNRVSTLGEMTASIAHEVSQPIAAMIANAGAGLRWLAAGNIDEAQQALSRISKDGHRASDVIARIRALAMKRPPRKEGVNLNEVINEVVALARGEVERGQTEIVTRLQDDLPVVEADRVQVQQVLLNLVVNAAEAMHGDKCLQREIVVASERDAAGNVVVSVRDSGPGLDDEQIARVFDPFYTTKSNGIGMGLAICRSIIEAHDGRLWAERNTPRGANFQFSLPSTERNAS